MNLYNIAESLILERASRNNIMKCLTNRNIAAVYYDDEEDPGGKGKRYIEIVAYGTSKTNNDVIRAYQIGGDTKTVQPGWKLFLVHRFVQDIEVLGGHFDTPRPNFNPNGDKSMNIVHKMVNFQDDNNYA